MGQVRHFWSLSFDLLRVAPTKSDSEDRNTDEDVFYHEQYRTKRSAMPDLSLERALGGRVAGLDEVGRGPLAGPVVAAAVVLPPNGISDALATTIDDSKRLTDRARRTLAQALRQTEGVAFALGAASVMEIDRLNILQASLLAMRRAFLRLEATGGRVEAALVDGRHVPSLPCPARAVVGGDGISLSIAAASIIAKVVRDDLMTALASRYPGYGWEHNAGYGTRVHKEGLNTLGATAHHRRSFAPVRAALGEGRGENRTK